MYSSVITGILTKNLLPEADFVFGFADLQDLITDKFQGFRYAISIGKRLDDNIIDKIKDGPTLEYLNHYNQVNKELTRVSEIISSELRAAGVECMATKPTINLNVETRYLEDLTYEISHKMVATRAGIGWIGKTDLLISFKFGPRLRFVSILLKENPGVIARPVEKSYCANCKICVIKCPAGAATGKSWEPGTHRDEFFNPFLCRNMCGELARRKLNVAEHICGLCVYICPEGKKRRRESLE